jgi:hypothetical protein
MEKISKIKPYAYSFFFLVSLILILTWIIKSGGNAVWAKTVTNTSTKVITFKDSDGDGLLDADDPHPNIAEIYIVEDKDKDGIVDSFEK